MAQRDKLINIAAERHARRPLIVPASRSTRVPSRRVASYCATLLAALFAATFCAGAACGQDRVLFEAYADDNWDIWIMNADGSDARNVTETPEIHELYPQASPDGAHICFLVDEPNGRDTRRSLWLMQRDGTGRHKLADGARHACWSPDGGRIAFAKQEFPRFQVKDYVTKRLYFFDVATGETTIHPNEAIEHIYVPTWSADGRWIIATVHGGMGFGHAIIGLEVEGDRVVDLEIGGCRPCLSADGRQLTWSIDDHTIGLADVEWTDDGPRVENVRQHHHHPTLHLYHPDFSPDGKQITFSMGPGGRMPLAGPGTQRDVAEMVGVKGPWDIYRKSIGGDETLVRLTNDPSRSQKESEWIVAP